MSKLVQANKVESGKLFIFNGQKYKWVPTTEYWRSLVCENGELVEPKDMPTELIIGKVKVEVLDEKI